VALRAGKLKHSKKRKTELKEISKRSDTEDRGQADADSETPSFPPSVLSLPLLVPIPLVSSSPFFYFPPFLLLNGSYPPYFCLFPYPRPRDIHPLMPNSGDGRKKRRPSGSAVGQIEKRHWRAEKPHWEVRVKGTADQQMLLPIWAAFSFAIRSGDSL